ncbi:MAG: HisA/HisF-related TIM barrel protein [Gammaproteobacteria bacterium]
MQIVPVIDLCKGVVVHAVKGNRKEYKAIDSKISPSPNPLDVITNLLTISNFSSIYVADLGALEQQNNHINIIESICEKFPNLTIWLDTGYTLIKHYLQLPNNHNLRLILSSESLPSTEALSSLINQYPKHDFILSLDYKANKLLGAIDLLQHIHLWPKDVIVLNLSNVGAKCGSQFPHELDKNMLTNNFNIYYGGGVRNLSDIQKLKSLNFTGALISTALHNSNITTKDIDLISQ